MIIINTTIVKGAAATNEAVCSASSPPANSKTLAMADIKNPITIFDIKGGFKLPFVVMLAKIYDAESAEVIKNKNINKIAEMEVNNDKGKLSNTWKSAIVISSLTASAIPISSFKSL